MFIADLNYLENATQVTEVNGGRRRRGSSYNIDQSAFTGALAVALGGGKNSETEATAIAKTVQIVEF